MKTDLQILIVGAGPVGLLLANLLGRRGVEVLVAERRTRPPTGSMAIGITPPSMLILKKLELDRSFADHGVPITSAKVFERGAFLGEVDFSPLAAEHRFILSLPQNKTIQLLRKNLKKHPSVHLVDGLEFVGQTASGSGCSVRMKDLRTDAFTEIQTRYLVGCDGARSAVRQQSGLHFPGRNYKTQFFMADFEDQTGYGSEAHLYFSPDGSVESFPLPDGKRRWIIQMPCAVAPEKIDLGATVVREVCNRTGIDLSTAALRFESSFRPQYRLAADYAGGGTLLCGDAAHVMSPIGGQGMNTGFADALHLDRALAAALESPAEAAALFADYNHVRRHSFRVAAHRAARGMWLGTRTGALPSALRRLFIEKILLHAAIREKLPPYFAMLTIPGSPLAKGAIQ